MPYLAAAVYVSIFADSYEAAYDVSKLGVVQVVEEDRGSARMSHDVCIALLQSPCRESPMALR